MVTSHATDFDAIGRPTSPSLPFQPHTDIARLAGGWMLRTRVGEIEDTHLWRTAMERPPTRQIVLDCVTCGWGIFVLSPDVERVGYQINTMQLTAAIVSHLHAHHEGSLNGRHGTGTGWPTSPAPGSDNARTGSDSGSRRGAGDRPADQAGHHQPDHDGPPVA